MNGLVKKAGLAIAMAATAVTGLTVGTAADAQRFGGYRGGYYGGYHGGYHRGGIGPGGAAVLGGLVGLGVGAAIADSHRGYGYGPGPYYHGYYGPGYRPYYGGYYGGYYAPRCWQQWRFDPYWGREVPVRVCG